MDETNIKAETPGMGQLVEFAGQAQVAFFEREVLIAAA